MESVKNYFLSIEFSAAVVFTLLFKACFVVPSITDAAFFFCAVANICHERWEKARREEREAKFLDQNLTTIQNQIDLMKADHMKVLKAAEDAKKAVSDFSMATGFQRPKRQ